MTEQTARQKAGELTREEVADYLRANPDFFIDQDELLRSLTLPHDSGRAISLVERQVHLFREQRDTLRRELVDQAPVETLGPKLERHPRFPARANIGFLQILDRTHVRLRVFERGSGETLACGSGACAAVVAGCLRGLLDARVEVELRGGPLVIEWQGEGTPVMMEGPATSVFEGQLRLPGDSGGRRRRSARPHKQRS